MTQSPPPPSEPSIDPASHREILERVPGVVGIWSTDEPPRLLFISGGVERLTGHTAREHLDDPGLWDRITHPEDRERTRSAVAAAVAGGTRLNHEYRIIRRDGALTWVEGTLDPIPDEHGRIIAWQGFSLDITARRDAEEAAIRSESRFRALAEQLPVVVYVDTDDVVSRCLYISPNVEDVFGLDPEEFLRTPGLWYRSLHPDDVQGAREAWRLAVTTGERFHREYRTLRPDGTVTWVRDICMPIAGPDGTTLFWHGVFLDITAQKRAEAEVRRSESRYRLLVEQIPAIIYEMGPDDERRPAYMSPHVEAMLGYTREEWLEQRDIWIELLHPDDRERELAAHDLHTATGDPWSREYRLIASDGEVVWVRDQAVLVIDPATEEPTWHGVMLDITAQKRAEGDLELANDLLELRVLERTTELADANEMMGLEIGERRRMEAELRRAEERYRLLVGQLPGVVYVLNVHPEPSSKAVELYNEARLTRMLGFEPSEWQNDPDLWKDRLHPDDRERVLADVARCVEEAAPYEDEYRFLAKDGRVVWVADRATVLTRDEDGRATSFSGFMVDITDRKEAELQAAAARRRFETLAEHGPAVSFLFERTSTASFRLSYISPQIERLTGWNRERFLEDPDIWDRTIHPQDLERFRGTVVAILGGTDRWSGDFRFLARSGETVWVRSEIAVLDRDPGGAPITFQGVMMQIPEPGGTGSEPEAAPAAAGEISPSE